MKTEFIGLEVVEETILKCGDCGTPLAFIVVSETNEHRTKRLLKPLKSVFKAINCHQCGGSSFSSKVFEGSTNICPVGENLNIDVVDTDIKDGIIITTFTVKK